MASSLSMASAIFPLFFSNHISNAGSQNVSKVTRVWCSSPGETCIPNTRDGRIRGDSDIFKEITNPN
jgi:hypothetical protein